MKECLKNTIQLITRIFILPVYFVYLVNSALFGKERAFPGFSQFLAQFPGLTGIYLRREFYRLVLNNCARDCVIGYGSIFAHHEVSLGAKVSIGSYCCFGAVKIAEGTQIASRVSIISGLHQHQRNDQQELCEGQFIPVSIGKQVWIGEGAIIARDVGDYSNIAAGAVVLKPVASNSTAVGNPAKTISN